MNGLATLVRNESQDIINVMNAIHCLMQYKQVNYTFLNIILKSVQNDSRQRDDDYDKMQRLQADRDQLCDFKSKLVVRVEELEKEVEIYKSKERAAQDVARKTKERLEAEKDEISKKFIQLQHRDVQYQVPPYIYYDD